MTKLKNDKFRVRSSLFFLTYKKYGLERCDTFLSFFEEKFPDLKSFVCVNENSEDGYMHFHLLVSFEKVIDCKSSKLFDIFVEGYGISHPHIKKVYKNEQVGSFDYCSSYEKAWNYCFKNWRVKNNFIDYITSTSIEKATIEYLLGRDEKLKVESIENLDWCFSIKGYKEGIKEGIKEVFPEKMNLKEKVCFSKKEGIILKEVKEVKVENLYKSLKDIAEKKGVVSALSFYEKSVSDKTYLSKVISLEKSLYKHVELLTLRKKLESSKAAMLDLPSLNSFGLSLINFRLLDHYLRKGMGMESLIIVGPSNTNKTLLAKAIGAAGLSKFKEKGQYGEYLFVTELDKLKDFNKAVHKILILDDVNLKSLSREQVIHLLDASNENVDIRCRNTNATLPAYVPRIITTNNIKNILKTGHKELLRRCLILFIEEPMLGATGEDFYHLDESVVEVYPLNLVNNISDVSNVINNNKFS